MLNLRIGFLLALRQLQRTNIWSTLLIIVVVVFTFINLVAVNGILDGIVDGALKEVRSEAMGDIQITPLDEESYILETERIFRELDTYPEVHSYAPHYEGLATIEANYKERRDASEERDLVATTLTGIDPTQEDAVLGLGSLIAEGSYFTVEDHNSILIGIFFIDRYAEEYGDIYESFEDVYPGDKVRVTVGKQTKEFTVKGIVDSKIDIVGLTIYIPEKEFRRIFNRPHSNAEVIHIKLNEGFTDTEVKKKLISSGIGSLAEIKTFDEGVPKFIKDVAKTFGTLGTFIGIISISVASITVFIIIFINILTRRRQIGILKAIGINKKTIQYAYMFQAGFYAITGTVIGAAIVFFGLVPYFIANPIDFPYSDVILEASVFGAGVRFVFLFSIMLIAGFFPAWLITRQNTLNAILGRK